jgi:hypothetical protein
MKFSRGHTKRKPFRLLRYPKQVIKIKRSDLSTPVEHQLKVSLPRCFLKVFHWKFVSVDTAVQKLIKPFGLAESSMEHCAAPPGWHMIEY